MDYCQIDDVELEAYPHHPGVISLYGRLERIQRLPLVNGRTASLEYLLGTPEAFEQAVAGLENQLHGTLSPELRQAIGLTRGRIHLAHLNRLRQVDPAPMRLAQQEAVLALEMASRLLKEVIREEIQAAGGLAGLLRDLPAERMPTPEHRQEAEFLLRLRLDNAMLMEAVVRARTPEVVVGLREMLDRGQLEQRKLEEKVARVWLGHAHPRVQTVQRQEAAAREAFDRTRERLSAITQAEKQAEILQTLYQRCRVEGRLDIFASIFANPPLVIRAFLNLPITVLGKVSGRPELLKQIFADPPMAEKLFANPLAPGLIFSRDMEMVTRFFASERGEVLNFFEQINAKGAAAPGLIGERFKNLYQA